MDGITSGETLCLLCRRTIDCDGDALSFVRFISDPADPLAPFDGASFHKDCFARWDRREEYLSRYVAFAGSWKDKLKREE